MRAYRAVGNRCAVDLTALNLPIPEYQAQEILERLGFRSLQVDIVRIARKLTGKARYKRGALVSKAPAAFDCSSFVKWLYGLRGIWLPRRSVQQLDLVYGSPVLLDGLCPGDLVFTTGAKNYYRDDPKHGIGHVGIATGWGTIVHAANVKRGVVEDPLQKFVNERKFRGALRPAEHHVITLLVPKGQEIETSDDLRWIILQNLP